MIMALTLPPKIAEGASKFGWDKDVDGSRPVMDTAFTPGSGAPSSGSSFPQGMDPSEAGAIQAIERMQQATFANDAKVRAEQEERQLREALRKQKLGKESLAIASMYNQINTLPDKIASAFGGTAQQQLMLGTYGNIPAIVSETYRTFPQRNIQAVAAAAPNTQYFGRG